MIPYHPRLASPRMRDIAAQLQAEVLYGHQRLKNLATNRIVAAMQLQNSLHWLQPDSLVITPGDRGDIIAGMLQAHQFQQLSGPGGNFAALPACSPTRPSQN